MNLLPNFDKTKRQQQKEEIYLKFYVNALIFVYGEFLSDLHFLKLHI